MRALEGRRWVLRAVAGVLMATGAEGGGGGATRDRAHATDASLARLAELVDQAPNDCERRRLLTSIEQQSGVAPAGDGAAAVEAMLVAGHHRYRLGDWAEAVADFEWVRGADVSDASVIDALRMLGQIRLFVTGDGAGSALAYSAMVERLDASLAADVSDARPVLLTEGLSKLGLALEAAGDHAGALGARRRLVESPEAWMDGERRSYALVEAGRSAVKVGDRALAETFYSAALANPSFGRADGSVVLYGRERIGARGWEEASDERVAALDELWKRPEHAGMAQAAAVGHEVATLRSRRGEEALLTETLLALDARLANEFDGYDAQERAAAGADRVYGDVLIGLGQWRESLGDKAGAAAYYLRFKQVFPEHRLAGACEERAQALVSAP